MVQLTRDKYKDIKKMDRTQMEKFLSNVFDQGYEQGVSTLSKTLAEKIDAGIRKTSGIGEKRYTELVKNITGELIQDGEDRSNTKAGE